MDDSRNPDELGPAPQGPGDDESNEVDSEAADPSVAAAEAAEMAATVEAILFASDSPLPANRIAAVAELGGVRAVRQAIRDLNSRYERNGSAFRIDEIAGGHQMLTLPQYHDVLSRLLTAKSEGKLSQAALEALAVIAYRQPILRADIEAIRGVACGEVLRGLMEKQLVKIVGRAEVLGRPMLYGTTRRFLEVFGLASLDDLPRVEELRGGRREANAPAGGQGTQDVSQAQPAPQQPAPAPETPAQSPPDQPPPVASQ